MATIFYSWQSDTPNRVSRGFLKPILESICKEISADASVDEPIRVDSDTQGVAGQPPIAETIFNKIDGAAVFFADMTFTGTRIDGRPIPNPNVLIEYGWALKSLGHNRVICVMNTAHGEPNSETLPFDLAHLRWPMRFNLKEDTSPELRLEERKRLEKELKGAIRASLATIPSPPLVPLAQFREALTKDVPGRFRGQDEPIGIEEQRPTGEISRAFLTEGPAMWLRLMPSVDPKKEWTIPELRNSASNLTPLFHPDGGYSLLRAADGIAKYPIGACENPPSHPNTLFISCLAFAFRSGEIWSIDSFSLRVSPGSLLTAEIEHDLAEGADNYRKVLQALGIPPPYRWKAGIVGALDRRLAYPLQIWQGLGPICTTDLIEEEGLLDEHQSTALALLPFFKKIFEECGIERPTNPNNH